MYIPIPCEMLPELGYREYDFVGIREPPSEATKQKLVEIANKLLNKIASSCVAPISRSIPIQSFKEALFNLPNANNERQL